MESEARSQVAGAAGTSEALRLAEQQGSYFPVFRKSALFILREKQHLLQNHVLLGLEKEKESSNMQVSDNKNSNK